MDYFDPETREAVVYMVEDEDRWTPSPEELVKFRDKLEKQLAEVEKEIARQYFVANQETLEKERK